MSACLSLYIFIYVYLYISISLYTFTHPPIHLFVCLSVCLSIYWFSVAFRHRCSSLRRHKLILSASSRFFSSFLLDRLSAYRESPITWTASGFLPSTCPAYEALPVVVPSSSQLSGPFDALNPLSTRWATQQQGSTLFKILIHSYDKQYPRTDCRLVEVLPHFTAS